VQKDTRKRKRWMRPRRTRGGEGRRGEDNEVEGDDDECTDYRRPRLKTERQDEDEE